MAKVKREYWRWREYNWCDKSIDWKQAEIITAGIDVGSVSSQCVIMVDGKIYAFSNARTGSSSPDSARKVLDWALEATDGMTEKDIHYIVGTGYGRVNIPMANKAITEIACHARGANFLYGPSVRTVLDMGGQDCKVIRVDEKGRVLEFIMNDKCAAGTGRGIEVIADLLKIPIEEIGDRSFDIDKEPPPVSSTCVVFAKSEALSLLRQGWPVNKVLAAYCAATAQRVLALLEKIGVEKEFAITGGIAKNRGIVERLERELGIEALKPEGFDPQIAGAVGAALLAKTIVEREKKRKRR